MKSKTVYSVILEMKPQNKTTLPLTLGHQTHALFLRLIASIDPALATQLHDKQGYRPFTVSSLTGACIHQNNVCVQPDQTCRLRVTLLDGGQLWQCLTTCILEARSHPLRLGPAEFILDRVLLTPIADPTGWADNQDWQSLAGAEAKKNIALRFASPTAFSMGNRRFALFPEPVLVWDSLIRSWNLYAPEVLHLDKQSLRKYVAEQVIVGDYHLQTTTLHFPKYVQKGFVGTCTYRIQVDTTYALQVTALAAFARYAGIGYKTTMGMGQARLEESLV